MGLRLSLWNLCSLTELKILMGSNSVIYRPTSNHTNFQPSANAHHSVQHTTLQLSNRWYFTGEFSMVVIYFISIELYPQNKHMNQPHIRTKTFERIHTNDVPLLTYTSKSKKGHYLPWPRTNISWAKEA